MNDTVSTMATVADSIASAYAARALGADATPAAVRALEVRQCLLQGIAEGLAPGVTAQALRDATDYVGSCAGDLGDAADVAEALDVSEGLPRALVVADEHRGEAPTEHASRAWLTGYVVARTASRIADGRPE